MKLKTKEKFPFYIKASAHAGSGIHNTSHWQEMGFFLSKLAVRFPEAEVINVGGGLGVKIDRGL